MKTAKIIERVSLAGASLTGLAAFWASVALENTEATGYMAIAAIVLFAISHFANAAIKKGGAL